MRWSVFFQGGGRFGKVCLLTLAVTLFLIFVGGLVRASGAGLGCPDWPRCFGLWIPPLSAQGLPAGFDPQDFNVIKTWTEYVNRLLGVLVGLLIIATCVLAWLDQRRRASVTLGATAALVLVIVQGWLGGQVVQSQLAGWMISIHMIMAVLILNVLLWTFFRARVDEMRLTLAAPLRARLLGVTIALMVVTLVQVVLGTQVREALGVISRWTPPLPRRAWIDEVGALDMVHRSASWLVLLLAIWLVVALWRQRWRGPLAHLAWAVLATVLAQVLIGVGLVYGSMSPTLQIFHLVLAAVMTSLQFLLLLLLTHVQVQRRAGA